MKISVGLLSVILAVAVAAPTPEVEPSSDPTKPCVTASQWEGRASEWDHVTEENNRFTISFDAVNRKKRVIEDKRSYMPGRRLYEYFYDYDTNSYYKVNLDDNICTKFTIQGPWQNHTIPSDATMEDEYEVGPAGKGLQVREWSDRLPGRRKESWIGIYSIEGCWPVVEILTYSDENTTISLTTRFFDITPGIKDMSVFDPPSICFNHHVEYTIIEDSSSPEPSPEPSWFKMLKLWWADKEDEHEVNDLSMFDYSTIPSFNSVLLPSDNSSILVWYNNIKVWWSQSDEDASHSTINPPSIVTPTLPIEDDEDYLDKILNFFG